MVVIDAGHWVGAGVSGFCWLALAAEGGTGEAAEGSVAPSAGVRKAASGRYYQQ